MQDQEAAGFTQTNIKKPPARNKVSTYKIQ